MPLILPHTIPIRWLKLMSHSLPLFISLKIPVTDNSLLIGVNILRIPTTYAAWIKVPGSELYHGN